MLNTLLLFGALASVGQAPPAAGAPSYTQEELAVGTIRSILSAQAYYKQTYPAVGYACDIETLVKAQALVDALSEGKTFNGYVFKIWCEAKTSSQARFRASAVPAKKAKGSSLTICTDETNVPRTVDGNAAACFEKGSPSK
jgi:hypothetical protein